MIKINYLGLGLWFVLLIIAIIFFFIKDWWLVGIVGLIALIVWMIVEICKLKNEK